MITRLVNEMRRAVMAATRLPIIVVILFLTTACDAYLAGSNSEGQLGVAASGAVSASDVDVGSPWVVLDAARRHTCGLTLAGTIWCWGDNASGQVGNGTTSGDQFTPAQVGTATDWTALSTFVRFTCGIRSGELWCWGSDIDGQLGNGSTTTANQGNPVRVGTASDWTAVSAGAGHACGIRAPDNLYCWGNNDSGQLGINSTTSRDEPVLVSRNIASVAAGSNHTCAIEQPDTLPAPVMRCWGDNASGQLGDGTFTNRLAPAIPVAAPPGRTWASVSAGRLTTCAITTRTNTEDPADTLLFCWGSNDFGQINSGSIGVDANSPVGILQDVLISEFGIPLGQFTNFYSQVSTGDFHMCAIQSGRERTSVSGNTTLTEESAVLCQGDDSFGQLGVGGLVPADAVPVSVSVGRRHSAMLVFDPP